MAFFYISPRWFFGWDIVLELLFGIVTAMVAYNSFKVYDLCEEKECRLFGFAFTALSISYFIWPLLNLFALSSVNDATNAISIGSLSLSLLIGFYLHMIFFLIGLATLVYVTFGIKNDKVYTLLVSLCIIVVIFSLRVGLAFNFVSALLLFYIAFYYLKRYFKLKTNQAWMIFNAFLLLFIARVIFVFASINHLLYVVVHLVELIAFGIIMVGLVKSVSKK
jgi:hypothetical protein